jgi:lysophospholipase L1-like esterase
VAIDERSREESRRLAAAPPGASRELGPPQRDERLREEPAAATRPAPPGADRSPGSARAQRAAETGIRVGGIRIDTFVALGDSFTEGLDDFRPDGSIRGWADRVAELIAARQGYVNYANLAVRGKVLAQIVADQFPAALAARPDLIGFSAGGNDILRPGSDPDAVAARFDDALATLRTSGARILVFLGMDPGRTPVVRLVRGKIAIYNEHLRAIAARQGCEVVDLWGLTPLRDPRGWGKDRVHLSSDGHDRVARLVAAVLGIPAGDPNEGWPHPPAPKTRRDDLEWTRGFFLPWLGRRLRRRSTGDGYRPKRPELEMFLGESGILGR